MVDTIRSEAIKAGIQRRQDNGLPVGNPSFKRQGVVSRILSDEYYENYIEPLTTLGHTQQEIAEILNRQNIVAPRGGRWFQSTISKILRKYR